MSFSIQRAVSDGSMVLLPISIEYFDRSEISVLFDGVVDARQWAWVGTTDTAISFTPAVANLVEVSVRRTTDISVPRHQFSQGAQFTVESLDEDIQQVLHIAQEAKEGSGLGEVYQNLNFHGFKAINMGNGSDPGDAVNHAQMQVHDATIVGYMNAADASADAAAISAAAALASELSAAAAAETAAVAKVNDGSTNAILKTSDTGAAKVPAGTTAQRDATPVPGMFRLNTTLGKFEGYKGGAWGTVGGEVTLDGAETLTNKTLVTPVVDTSIDFSGIAGVIKVGGVDKVVIGSQGIEAGSFKPGAIKSGDFGGGAGTGNLTTYTTAITPMPASGTLLSGAHSLGVVPAEVGLEMTCLTAEQGFSIGDVVQAYGEWNGSNAVASLLYKTTTSVGIMPQAGYTIYIKHKTTGQIVTPTAANWSYRFRLRAA